jgi:hypothetical protein
MQHQTAPDYAAVDTFELGRENSANHHSVEAETANKQEHQIRQPNRIPPFPAGEL